MASEDICWIYIATCTDGKYYIGRTDDPTTRLLAQLNGKGSQWTKMYKVIEFRIFLGEPADEDKYTIKYMAQFGIENVRGGSYSKIELEEADINMANKQCANITDNCFACGGTGHFAKRCKQKLTTVEKKISKVLKEKKILKIHEDPEEESPKSEKKACEKCGRTSHTTDKCFAKRTKYGGTVGKKCDKCGRVGHTIDECYAKTKIKT